VVTIGMACLGVVLFIVISRLFPMVTVEAPARPTLHPPPLGSGAAPGRGDRCAAPARGAP
jgi:hypothetical protein